MHNTCTYSITLNVANQTSMSKRKRDDEPDQGPRSRKQRKLIKQKKREKKASKRESHRLEQSVKSTPPTYHITQPSEKTQVANVLEPPPGLSKRQRKRWRKRQSRLTKAPDLDREALSQSTKAPPPSKQPPPKPEGIVLRKTPDRDALLQAASTRLMLRRNKVWHDHGSARAGAEGDGTFDGDDAGKRLRVGTSPATESPKISVGMPTDRAATNPKPRITVSQALDSTSEVSTTSQDLPLQVRQPQVQLRAPKLPRASARRTSFGQKVNSVPSVTNSGDPVAAFKRFSAFVHDGDSDDSSEDSESSEGEDKFDDRNGSGEAARTAENANPANRLKDTTNTKGHDHAEHESPIATAGAGSESLSRAKESVARFSIPSLLEPIPATSNGQSAASRKANVGIKRQISTLGHQIDGNQPGSDSAPPVVAMTSPSSTRSYALDPFNVSEADSKDALQIMEDLSESMFTTTRALPASKFDQGWGPRSTNGADGLTNVDSSYAGVIDLPSTLARFRSSEGYNAEIAGQRVSVICHTARVEGIQHSESTLRQTAAQPETSGTSASSNIVVGTREGEEASSGSSAPLSVLSKTPTPPAQPAPIGSVDRVEEPESLESKIEASAKVPSASPVPAKKRKMTGRTSKHFTPQKQPRRRKSKAAMELEQASTTDFTDEGEPDRLVRSAPRAEDELKATFRAEAAIRALQTPVRRSSRFLVVSDDGEHEGSQNLVQENTEQTIYLGEENKHPNEPEPLTPTRLPRKKRKSTGKKSTYFTPQKPPLDTTYIDRVDLYNTTGSTRKGRVPAGVSIAPVPSIHCPTFGIIQEKLWREPFWLLVAVTFLNKTTGRAAAPAFWRLKEKYKTPKELAEADEEELREMIHHLGFQTQRSRRLVKMAKAWVEKEPVKGRRWRCLHYPVKGDGKEYKPLECVEEDADEVGGVLEIAHLPGCGPYAWDSWRIFCRDVLRGVAEDYNGLGAKEEHFVPEWKKVLPLDKELRACLRWMWLGEGWIWDCGSGGRRAASEEEMERAVRGEAEIDDPLERKFAAQAAGKELETPAEGSHGGVAPTAADKEDSVPEPPSTPKMSAQDDRSDASSNIVVTPRSDRVLRRSRRLTS